MEQLPKQGTVSNEDNNKWLLRLEAIGNHIIATQKKCNQG